MTKWLPLLAAIAFLRVYDPGSNLAAAPVKGYAKHDMMGSFGIEHRPEGSLGFLGGVEVRMKDRYRLGGVVFDIGARYRLTPGLSLEVRHGSWHNIDRSGSVEHWNYLGMEVGL